MAGMKSLVTVSPRGDETTRFIFDDEMVRMNTDRGMEFVGTSIGREQSLVFAANFDGFFTVSAVTEEEALAYIREEMGEEVASMARRAWVDPEDFEDEAPS